jgi:small subunit ribosomal protein S6
LNQYEAMFVFDPTFGATFENCETEIRRLMTRAEAEILLCQRWDERRLAYKIKGRKRGVYVLVYFKAPTDKITPLERDAQLSEQILRLLVLRADDMTLEMMQQAAAARAESPESERGDGDNWSDRGPSRNRYPDSRDRGAVETEHAAAKRRKSPPKQADEAVTEAGAKVVE